MSKISNFLKKFSSNPFVIFCYINKTGALKFLPDKAFLKIMFHAKYGKKLNLDNPQLFGEKLQWLKLYDRKPEHTVYADKVKVRDYIKNKIGEEYLIPLIGVWDSPDEIDFNSLPDKFVLKCNHNSGSGMFICKDKSKIDKEKVIEVLQNGLSVDYYKIWREWPYKDIPRKVLCEKYICDSKTGELRDYKFFCFNGKPMIMCIISGRTEDVEDDRFDFYDMDSNHLDISYMEFKNADTPPDIPENFELMKQLAEKLAEDNPFVRIDLYEADSKVYFGEITYFPSSGYNHFYPDDWNKKLGSWIKLEK